MPLHNNLTFVWSNHTEVAIYMPDPKTDYVVFKTPLILLHVAASTDNTDAEDKVKILIPVPPPHMFSGCVGLSYLMGSC